MAKWALYLISFNPPNSTTWPNPQPNNRLELATTTQRSLCCGAEWMSINGYWGLSRCLATKALVLDADCYWINVYTILNLICLLCIAIENHSIVNGKWKLWLCLVMHIECFPIYLPVPLLTWECCSELISQVITSALNMNKPTLSYGSIRSNHYRVTW